MAAAVSVSVRDDSLLAEAGRPGELRAPSSRIAIPFAHVASAGPAGRKPVTGCMASAPAARCRHLRRAFYSTAYERSGMSTTSPKAAECLRLAA